MVVKEKMIILYNTALWGRGDRGSVVDGGVDVGVGVTVMGEWEGGHGVYQWKEGQWLPDRVVAGQSG